MDGTAKVVIAVIFFIILFAFISIVTKEDDGLCSSTDNQYVDDQSWYELCKEDE